MLKTLKYSELVHEGYRNGLLIQSSILVLLIRNLVFDYFRIQMLHLLLHAYEDMVESRLVNF